MNIVLRALAAIMLTAVFLPLAAVNHMDLLTRIDGEFNGSKMGYDHTPFYRPICNGEFALTL